MAKKLVENSRTRCSSREEFVRSPMSRIALGKTVRKGSIKNGWENALARECLFVHRQQGLLLFVYVDDIRMVGKKNNLQPVWKGLMKQVDMVKRTQFLDQVNFGCTQLECKPNKKFVDEYIKSVRIVDPRRNYWEVASFGRIKRQDHRLV